MTLPTKLSELKRHCALDPSAAAFEIEHLRSDLARAKERIAVLERVREAAKARLEVWTRETYDAVVKALAAADASSEDGT